MTTACLIIDAREQIKALRKSLDACTDLATVRDTADYLGRLEELCDQGQDEFDKLNDRISFLESDNDNLSDEVDDLCDKLQNAKEEISSLWKYSPSNRLGAHPHDLADPYGLHGLTR